MSVTAVLAAAAPSPSVQAQAAATVHFDVSDSGYVNLPQSLPAGRVTLVMRNIGQIAHHAKLVKLKDDASFDDYANAVLQGRPTGALITALGGNGVVDPGVGGDEVTFDLAPGSYVVLDVLRAPDGELNAAKGLLQQVQVVDTPPPPTAASVILRDFSIDGLPDALSTGRSTLRIDNQGPLAHELLAARLAPGKTAEEFAAFMTTVPAVGQQPFQSIGGFQSADPDFGAWSTLDLTPGDYVFFCNLTNPRSGLRHFEEGMLQQVTVR